MPTFAGIGTLRVARRKGNSRLRGGTMSFVNQVLAGLARLSNVRRSFVFVKKLDASRLMRPLCAAIALGALLFSAGAQTAPPASLQQRLQAIFDMSAED